MTQNIVSRIPISMTAEDRENLYALREIFEQRQNETPRKDKRLSLAEVMREAIKIALRHA